MPDVVSLSYHHVNQDCVERRVNAIASRLEFVAAALVKNSDLDGFTNDELSGLAAIVADCAQLARDMYEGLPFAVQSFTPGAPLSELSARVNRDVQKAGAQ